MYNIPFRLKIATFYFFLQGGLGMILCVALWFFPIKSITMKILFFIFIVLYSILNIEVGKGLRRLKKWSFIVAILICILEPLAVIFDITEISPLTFFGSIVIILLLTLAKLFWQSQTEIYNQNIVT
jgi:hypothetical protein